MQRMRAGMTRGGERCVENEGRDVRGVQGVQRMRAWITRGVQNVQRMRAGMTNGGARCAENEGRDD